MAGSRFFSRRTAPRLVLPAAGLLAVLSGCALWNGGRDAPLPPDASTPATSAPTPSGTTGTISAATPSGTHSGTHSGTPETSAAPPVAATPDPAPAASPPRPARPKPATAAKTPAAAAGAQSGRATAATGKPSAAAPAAVTLDGVTPNATAPAAAAKPSQPSLDLAALEQRLKDTKAIGVFTKLSLKNQVDDLLDEFRKFHQAGGRSPPPPGLRSQYDLLMIKVLSLLQTGDPQLATSIASSREALWDILKDPNKFAKI